MKTAVEKIETERLTLREFADADVEALCEIHRDRDHMRFMLVPDSRLAFETWLRRYAGTRVINGFAPWTVVDRLEARIVGWGGLNIDPSAPEWGPEVIYFIHPSYAGRGFATEVTRASLRLGFEGLGLDEIGAFARTENRASIRVLEKCGFKLLRYEPALERNHYRARGADWLRI